MSMGATTTDGATAEVTSERIQVRSPRGQVLFEYYAGEERCVVYAPGPDLDLVAERRIRIAAGEMVALEGKTLSAIADQAELEAEDVRIRSKTLSTISDAVHQAAGVVEVNAERWVGRFKHAYQQVEELSQTHAGRIRAIAKETFQLLGKRTILKAEEDLKVKGERIHLG